MSKRPIRIVARSSIGVKPSFPLVFASKKYTLYFLNWYNIFENEAFSGRDHNFPPLAPLRLYWQPNPGISLTRLNECVFSFFIAFIMQFLINVNAVSVGTQVYIKNVSNR